jgi:hypothetical protein
MEFFNSAFFLQFIINPNVIINYNEVYIHMCICIMQITSPASMYVLNSQIWDWQYGNFTPRKFRVLCMRLSVVYVWKPHGNLCQLTFCWLEIIGNYGYCYITGSGMFHSLVFKGEVSEIKYFVNIKMDHKESFLVLYGLKWHNLFWTCYWCCSRNLTALYSTTGTHGHMHQEMYLIMSIMFMKTFVRVLWDRLNLTETYIL